MTFTLFVVFETHRNCYAALLSADRSWYAPFNILPFQKQLLESLLMGDPTYGGAYQVLLDGWRALGCTVTSLRITATTPEQSVLVRGGIRLFQKSPLGTNIVDLDCAPADAVVLSVMLRQEITIVDEALPVLCVKIDDPAATDVIVADQIRRGMAILENSQEMKLLLSGG